MTMCLVFDLGVVWSILFMHIEGHIYTKDIERSDGGNAKRHGKKNFFSISIV